MPIEIQLPPDPSAFEPDRQTVVIGSTGLRQLSHELHRYCLGEVDGRSFLIAGHRGAGKTTMVNYAIAQELQALRQSKPEPGSRWPKRPLVVRLHGPNFVGSAGEPQVAETDGKQEDGEGKRGQDGKEEQEQGKKKVKAASSGKVSAAAGKKKTPGSEGTPAQGSPPGQSGGSETDAASDASTARDRDPAIARVEFFEKRKREADQETPERQPIQTALQQITLGLQRALAKEICDCYRERIRGSTEPSRCRRLYERVAQLEMELDLYETPARLREYWAAGGFLYTGVLYPPDEFGRGRQEDQGLRELVALASVCHAYERVSGTFDKAELKDTVSAADTRTLATGGKEGMDLLAPILSLVTGGATGTVAVAGMHQSLVVSTLAGALAAFATAGVFKYTSSRTRTRNYSTDFSFVPNLKIETLERVVPMLIDRIRDAGLVPVFVVDELDKVEQKGLEEIVRYVKTIVAERAFFCFLTDRNYYEQVTRRNIMDPYPKEYTYFSDRIFVAFRSIDLHEYLGRILRVQEPTEDVTRGPAPAAPGPAVVGAAQTAQLHEDKVDLELLPYVLLRQCELHAVDLRRQLAIWRGAGNVLDPLRLRLRTDPARRFDLLIQFTVELILHRVAVTRWQQEDPARARLLHDALYYPIRMWGKPAPNGGRRDFVLDLTDAGRGEFEDYLKERMSSEPKAQKNKKPEPDGQDLEPYELAADEVDLLYGHVRDLAGMLADPFAIMDELASRDNLVPAPPKTLLETLPYNPPNGQLLVRLWPEQHKYEWQYDAAVRPRPAGPVDQPSDSRMPLAYQLDLHVGLAIRMVMESENAKQMGLSPGRRHLLEYALRVLWVEWLNGHSVPTYRGIAAKIVVAGLSDMEYALSAVPEPVDDLERLLSDYALYIARLDESGLRARYEVVLNSAFPRDQRNAPLLRADLSDFQYDRDGNARAPDLAFQAWSDIHNEWKRSLLYVTSMANILDTWMSR